MLLNYSIQRPTNHQRQKMYALHEQLFSCEDNMWGLYQITTLAHFDIVNSTR